ncbi:hypothetical protein, conserved [Plasmodium gonderi]|uniref:Uncharacterized protein n=1 Tax=Plasmodium gonderi TaxID=77519 RepID=A0A1Y1JQ52_PLAGO|nr:hypothetical protein, conserved [Plasmodium gonderi]GAW83605.1 hypothetical protein, conserved [Plasmodium gonderi]
MIFNYKGKIKGVRNFYAFFNHRNNEKACNCFFFSVLLPNEGRNRRSSIGGIINTPTGLIVKCVNDTYKSKNFNKIKWNCIKNDILKNIDKFHTKEILKIANIVSRLHFGKNILMQFIKVLKCRLNNINADNITRIMISYIKANIKDDLFYNELCSIIKNNLQHISHSLLINLVFNINKCNIKNHNIMYVQKLILYHLISHFDFEGFQIEGSFFEKLNNSARTMREWEKTHGVLEGEESENNFKRNELGDAADVGVASETTKTDIESHADESGFFKSPVHTNLYEGKKYDEILLFYSLSNYVFMTYLESQCNFALCDDFAKCLKNCFCTMNKASFASEERRLGEFPPFYIFLLYKAILNGIYIFEDKNISCTLLFKVKDKINNVLIQLKNKETFMKKGKTNEIIKYINILQQNLFHYSQNRKTHFLNHFENNVALVKTMLSILQESNQNDINRYKIKNDMDSN